MKTTFDCGNGIKITIDQTDSDIDEPLFDESQFAPHPDAADDDYVDDNDYDDDDEQDAAAAVAMRLLLMKSSSLGKRTSS